MNFLIIFAAQYLIFIVGLLSVYAWWRLPATLRMRVAVQAVLAVMFALMLVQVAGTLHSDVRPFVANHFTPLIPHANDNGFPSDHTTFSMLAAFTILPFARKWGLALTALALLVGLGRIGAGVHSLQDILGGIVVAALAATGAYYGARWLNKKIPTSQKTAKR